MNRAKGKSPQRAESEESKGEESPAGSGLGQRGDQGRTGTFRLIAMAGPDLV